MRNDYIDNIKGYLIILVVVGHIIERMMGNFDIARQLYMFIYIFHIPAFTFLSGYFTTKEQSMSAVKKNFIRILLPYMIFQVLFLIIMCLYNPTITTKSLIYSILTPQYALWYIFCLFVWKTTLPWFLKLPYPIILSIAIGLLSGLLPKYSQVFSSSRILAFFPFFVMGYYAQTKEWFPYQPANSHNSKYKAVSIAILLYALTCSVILNGRFQPHFLYSNFYYEIGQPVWLCFLFRLIAYLSAFLTGLAFMLLIPKTRTIISLIGERSLYVYLLHSLILYIFVQSKALSTINNLYVFAGITISGVFLAVLLSTNTIQRITRPLVEPYKIWFLRKT